jgi:DNA-binding NtrC family response regulator
VGKPSKLLVVCDDDALFCSALEYSLRRDYSIISATNLEQLWAISTPITPFAIILDINIGQANGLDHIGKVAHHFPHSKIIVMTGEPSVEKTRRAFKGGAVDFLPKGTSFDTLVSALKSIVVVPATKGDDAVPLETKITEVEKAAVKAALEASNFKIDEAADRLGVTKRTVFRLAAKHKIERGSRSKEISAEEVQKTLKLMRGNKSKTAKLLGISRNHPFLKKSPDTSS